MKSSHRFRIAGLIAASLSLFAQSSGFSAEVGWSSPDATDSPAATLWLNDATGATTYSQGLLQLNGSRDGLVIGATDAGVLSLSGPSSVIRTGLTAGTQSLNVGAITSSGDWQIDGSGQLVVNSQIIDPLGDVSKITKTGVGALLLNDASTYTGGTTLSQGTLVAGNNRAFGTGALALNGGTLSSTGPEESTRTFANNVIVGNNMTFGDSANPGSIAFSSGIDLQGAVRTFTTSANVTFDGVVTNGGIVKAGAAALTMTGINTYAGGTTLTEGVLFAANNSSFGTGNLALGSTTSPTISSDGSGADAARTFANTVTINGNVTFGDGKNDGAMLFATSANLGTTGENRAFTVNAKTTFAGGISGGAGLTKLGDGVLTLSGSNSYSGGTTFTAGMILAGSNNSFGTGALFFNGGAVGSADITPHTFANAMVFLGDLTVGDYVDSIGALTFTNQVDLGGEIRRITTKSNATFSGVISNGGITKDGLGALILTGTNTYAGGTTLSEGSLFAGNDFAFGTGVLNLNGGILASSGGSRSFNNLITMASGTVQFGDASHLDALTFAGNTLLAAGRNTFNTVANTTFSGVIEGQNASLVKQGAGNLTLTNVNSYDGGTELQAGTLRLGNNSSIGSGAITFSGGTLASASNEARSIANNTIFNGNATIGDNAKTGDFLFLGSNNDLGSTTRTITTNVATTFSNGLVGSGGLIKAGAESLTLRGASRYAGDTAVQAGKLVLDGTLASRNVTVAGGASFGGQGRFEGVLSGAGSVDPGNSPGILTVGQVDPRSAGNTSFNFEFTQTGAPNWSNAAATGNDVLRITDTASPFLASLGNENIVNLYFNPSVTATFTTSAFTSLQGGFFTDKSDSNSLASAIAGANFQYYFEDPRGSVVYNNTRYLTQVEARANGLLPNYGQSFFVSTARVPLANFDGQSVINGFVMRVMARTTVVIGAVPEIDPASGGSTLSLVAGVLALLDHRRRQGFKACSGVRKVKSA
jgi:autotransporter-associated beta strand protein